MPSHRVLRFLLSATVTACSIATFGVPARAHQAPSDSTIRTIIKERVDAGRFAGIAVGTVTRDGARRVVAYGPNAGVTPA
jgi:hypothetical protein